MHIIVLPLLLLCHGVANIHCSAVHESRPQDLRSLLDFKRGITSDPHRALSNWTTRSHFCYWECTLEQPRRVWGLQLSRQCLSGQISSSLGNLTFLYELDLSYNNFVDISSNSLVGSIPPKLGLLSNLGYLNLRSNQLNGSIPGELGQLKLKYLILGDNKLSGEIPQAFFRLSSLQYLSLELNMLGKALPPNIGELLPNLIEVTLENNNFEGPIPDCLGNNALGLKMIDLSYNNFTGRIPTSLGKLSNLTFLNLQDNQLVARKNQDWEFLNALRNCRFLEGSLPQSIGDLSTSLQVLLLGGNSLSSQVPQSIGKLSALTWLGLGENNFSGTIEGWIENLKRIRRLCLQSNNFTGPILSSISNLTQFYNNLLGPISQNFGNLQQLALVDLRDNNLATWWHNSGDITQVSTKLK
ncbi:hypothetical protein GQ55_1G299800 [Panicum hallii var. hallii]|uniref:Leucine-rich repeat-containing N-terminal plant-type domain-containing protein n=1 Tax=Panicum hallii var. hallii TaxID=1504633 RepID=A0A2T7F8Z9_9POAL|nr:hypothetical protein GQ55_1G299800 [Panicum hallii var. hallii]